MDNTDNQQQPSPFQKDFALAVQTLKKIVLTLAPKKLKIVTDWILKWASYLLKENLKKPFRQVKYNPGEIVLVDFGFRVGNEFGGRHYAIVLENNNNPKSGVVFLAPVTSYDQTKGESAYSGDVDLGIGAISFTPKGAAVKVSQIGAYSKLRIEKTCGRYIDNVKFNEIIERFCVNFEKKLLTKSQ